jgi:hypothetical protein
MLEQRLIYLGGGRYQAASRLDLELAEKTWQRGEKCAAKITHQRSVKQNNTFHLLIQYAFDNQRGGAVFENWQSLKKYLLIKAGHFSERRFQVGELKESQAVAVGKALAQALRSRDDYVAIAYAPGAQEFIERTAKSTRFTAVMADEMGALFDKVATIICQEIIPGTEPEELVAMAKSSCKQRRAA